MTQITFTFLGGLVNVGLFHKLLLYLEEVSGGLLTTATVYSIVRYKFLQR